MNFNNEFNLTVSKQEKRMQYPNSKNISNTNNKKKSTQKIHKKTKITSFVSYKWGVPIVTICYVIFYVWFLLEAWGTRGEFKPLWFQIADILMFPTYLIPFPFVSAIIVGVIYGFILVRFAKFLIAIVEKIRRKSL